jgi:hypothetical protein
LFFRIGIEYIDQIIKLNEVANRRRHEAWYDQRYLLAANLDVSQLLSHIEIVVLHHHLGSTKR